MSNLVKLEMIFPRLVEQYRRHEQRLRLIMIATVQTNRAMLFDKEGAHNGHPKWAPLVFRLGQILSDRGNLRKSIAPTNKGKPGPGGIAYMNEDVITVGSQLGYAALMNWGTTKMPDGKLRPTNAKALRIPLPQGKSLNENVKKDIKSKKLRTATGRAYIKKMNADIKQHREDLKSTSNSQRKRKLGKMIKKKQDEIKKTEPSKRYIFRKWVKIPARRFDEWNDIDQTEYDATILTALTTILNGGRP